MRLTQCPGCGSKNILIGQAYTQDGRPITPNYCGDCGYVSTQRASAQEAAEFERQNGGLKRVYTSTEQRLNRGEEVAPREKRNECCEVCASHENVELHHWAPAHLFGPECSKWPTSWLCRPCHLRWHRLVTPRMAERKGEYRKHYDAVKERRRPC